MAVVAKLSNVRISPQKARLVADQIRGLQVGKADHILTFGKQKAAKIMQKVLRSALANAENNNGMDVDTLKVFRVFVDAGPISKRFSPRARGRADRIIKRTSHITLMVADESEE